MKSLERAGISDNALIFAHTVSHTDLPGWVSHVRRTGVKGPRTVILLQFSPNLAHRLPDGSRLALRSFYASWFRQLRGTDVVWATDSSELAHEYETIGSGSANFRVFPIPLNHEVSGRRDNDLLCQADVPTLLYLGDARIGKGFDLLPDLARKLRESGRRLQFTVHCGRPPLMQDDARVRRAFSELEQLATEDVVKLITGTLDAAAYAQLLSDADCLLLPCRREHYGAQTSNVLAEALALGRPAVVPADTWLAARVLEFGAGVTFASGNPRDLTRATLSLVDHLSDYRGAAQRAAPGWRRRHNADNFVRCLFDATWAQNSPT